MMARRISCAGAMDFPRAPYEAMQEQPPRWDFRNWDYRTILAQTPDERDAIHQYQVYPQRRTWAKVAAAQHQRDTTDINPQVEATAGRRRAQAQASNAIPSSRTPLIAACESSTKTAKLSLHSPQPKQMSNNREEDKREGQGTWVQDEDQALVIVDECRFGEQQELQVVVVQEPRSAESLSSPPPLWIDEPDWWLDRVSPPTPPQPPPRKEDGDMEEQTPPSPPLLPRPPGMSLAVDDGSLRGRKIGNSDRDVGVLFQL